MPGMNEPQDIPSDIVPLFAEDEWNIAQPKLTRDMTAYLTQYRTPVFRDIKDHGEGWGSGSFIELEGKTYILTNEHVAKIRHRGEALGFQFADQEALFSVRGNHVDQSWPWDLALLPVTEKVWTGGEHASKAIQIGQIALAHTPMPTEVFALAGFAGEGTSFHFNTLVCKATTSLAREVELPKDNRWDKRFHLGLDYRPDLATNAVGKEGLPTPPGLSGSTVWNTCFVEAKKKGIGWSPELAQVAGVVWGWPSGGGFIVATRAEHVRSFLLGAPRVLAAIGSPGATAV